MLSERLKKARIKRGYSQQEAAEFINVSTSTLGMYEQGRRDPGTGTLKELARLYNVSIDYLLDLEMESAAIKGNSIPIYRRISNNPSEIIDYISIPEGKALTGDYMALQLQDKYMEPMIMYGDVVIISRKDQVEDDDIAAVMFDNKDAIIRRYTKHPEGIVLASLSPCDAKFYTRKEVRELPITILGKVVELRRML